MTKHEKDKLYGKARQEYLAEHPNCERCGADGEWHVIDVHHSQGRLGALLWDKRHFKALCRSCHHWAHQNPQAARKEGLICEKGKWNVVDKS